MTQKVNENPSGFYFQNDYWEGSKYLPKTQQKDFVFAVVSYYFSGEEPTLKRDAMGQFIQVKKRIDMARNESERKKNYRDKRRDTIRDKTRTLLNKEGEGEYKEDIPNGISKKNTPFSPPSVDEVRAYANEYATKKGIEPIDAERFCDFYTSKGWMVGKNEMKDWKACVRTWCRDAVPGSGEVLSDDFNEYL